MAVGVTDTKSQSSNITVIFKVIDQATKELNKISSSFSKIDSQVNKSAKASGGAATGFTKFGAAIAKAGVVIAGAAVAFGVGKKALDELLQAGEEGAAFLQTTLSFQQMTAAVGVSTDVLDRMRASTQGTISDMQLMSYATTAMAGASGEFGKRIGDALPQLAEIAKAANKANPALGSVDYQFQSLIVGLKRLSPRLIDNTGLQLKLGEAYEEFAQKAGKATDELSSEEQQLALLEATLEAGGRLLNQVGGTAESLTDPFQQLKAATENLTNQWKAGLYPAAAAVAKILSIVVEHLANIPTTEKIAKIGDDLVGTSASYDEYYAGVQKAIEGTALYIAEVDGQIVVMEKMSMGNRNVTQEVGFLTEAQWDAIQATKANDEHMARLASQYGKTAGAARKVITEQDKLKKEMSDLEFIIKGPVTSAYKDHTKSMEDLRTEQVEIIDQIKELGGAQWFDPAQAEKIAAIRAELGGVWGQMNDVNEALEKGLGPKKKYAAEQNLKSLKDTAADLEKQLRDMGVTDMTIKPGDFEDLAELKRKLEENKKAIEEETAAWKENQKQIMLDMVQRQLFAVLPEGEAISAYADVAEKMGLIDEQTANAYGMVGELSSMFANEKITVKEYADLIATLAGYLGELPDDITVDVLVNYTETGNRPPIGSGGATAGGGGSKQSIPVVHAVGGYTAADTPAVFHPREVYIPGRSGYTLASNDLKAIMSEMGMTSGGSGNMFYMDFRGSNIGSREDVEILAYRVAEQLAKRKR